MDIDFERSKIYEKLAYRPMPEDYKGSLPWLVQMQIAATNGKQYYDRVGKLKQYPRYELPVAKVERGLMLDIGCGWGRWLVAGDQKGYIPVGMDLRLEFCEASLETLKSNDIKGYAVAGDLKELPFQPEVFDFIWSFSVIQHTHKTRMEACIENIYRILKTDGFTKLEFPSADGFRNKRGPVNTSLLKADDFNSWVVRYYPVEVYKKFFMDLFGNFRYEVHSFLGIGVLKEDLKYVSLKNKILCALSLFLTQVAKHVPPIKKISDSIYTESYKTSGETNETAINAFLKAHHEEPYRNVNIVHLLQCPITGESLQADAAAGFVTNLSRTISYPVINNIPVIIRSEARSV